VNPEAPKASEPAPEVKAEPEAEEPTEEIEVEVDMSAETPEVEAPNDMDVIMTELSQVKERLFELQKQAASTGLKHKAPTPKKEPLNLQNLSIEERVRALSNHYNA
jgi:tetrahydromethanopterin S-methyltransferase subunit B